jgi:L-ribulose-5-phosphate 4-epimerase
MCEPFTRSFAELREQVLAANLALVRNGLVALSFGNASAVDRVAGVMIIKPSGVPYDELQSEDLVAVSLLDGSVLGGGDLRPSSDTPTHLGLYRAFPSIGGVVHTHSRVATAWAQAGRSIPSFGTTHADHFHGPVPVTRALVRAEVGGQYEAQTGEVIAETIRRLRLSPDEMPGILVASHGPFTWGHNAADAASNAVALETVAAMAIQTLSLNPDVEPIPDFLLERHYLRKHGPSAYYGQRRIR